MPSFDGINLIITLDSGITDVDVQVDLYSAWKTFMKSGTNAQFPLAFRTIGGDALDATRTAGATYFLRNDLGWRIRPAEENATINFIGSIAANDITLPIMIPTIGAFTVLINGLQPVSEGVEILTQKDGIETGFSLQAALRIVLAAVAGKASGLNVNLPVYRDVNDLKDRITAVTDASGNRITVTVDVS